MDSMDTMETEHIKLSSKDSSIGTTWILIYTTIVLFVTHQIYVFTYYRRKGIPGPMPLPVIGNTNKMMKGFLSPVIKWRKQYGKTFGIYNGMSGFIVTSDLDTARLVLVKEFASFQARDNGQMKIKYFEDALTNQTGAAWKRSRSYLSPAFSASKMKQLIPALNGRCDVMLEILAKKHEDGEGFETKPLLMAYVLDCIAHCAFGIDASCQTDAESPFVKNAKAIMDTQFNNIAFMIIMMFPKLTPLINLLGLEFFPVDSMDFFANNVKQIVEMRRSGEVTGAKDFIQMMIDASAEVENMEEDAKDATQNDRPTKKVPLTTSELLGQSLIFFLAGFDTISTTTGFFLYAVARYPEVQDKLHEEIDDMTTDGEPVGYNAVFTMEYLDKVWLESMRMWPIAFGLTRYCNKEFVHEGLVISPGDTVFINTWDIHRDPENYPDPETFDPERFNKDVKDTRHPCTYLPFGFGPRNCVGMRFAILEAKIAIIRILQKYRLELMPETEDLSDVSTLGYPSSLYPTKGIHIRHVPRN